jgi:hypothetical protein
MTSNRKTAPALGEPSSLTGDWTDWQQIRFWHDGDPLDAKYFVEKVTGVLLSRDASLPVLTYRGMSSAGGDSRSVWLRHEAVIDARNLYSLDYECKAQRKWISEERFQIEAERRFAFLCSKLEVARKIDWSEASAALLDQRRSESIDREESEASVIEDPVPVAAMQRAVLDALRNGMGVFTAHKEGGTHIFFDGTAFRRLDYGEEPNADETYSTDEAILSCLRQFFDWEARRPVYPHQPSELAVWTHVMSRLIPRNR